MSSNVNFVSMPTILKPWSLKIIPKYWYVKIATCFLNVFFFIRTNHWLVTKRYFFQNHILILKFLNNIHSNQTICFAIILKMNFNEFDPLNLNRLRLIFKTEFISLLKLQSHAFLQNDCETNVLKEILMTMTKTEIRKPKHTFR